MLVRPIRGSLSQDCAQMRAQRLHLRVPLHRDVDVEVLPRIRTVIVELDSDIAVPIHFERVPFGVKVRPFGVAVLRPVHARRDRVPHRATTTVLNDALRLRGAPQLIIKEVFAFMKRGVEITS